MNLITSPWLMKSSSKFMFPSRLVKCFLLHLVENSAFSDWHLNLLTTSLKKLILITIQDHLVVRMLG